MKGLEPEQARGQKGSYVADSEPLSPETLEDAIAAFDAGNHAWGRYRHFVLSARPAALAVPTQQVRDALSEAAISVPDAQSGEPGPFLAALRETLAALRRYRAFLPADVPLAEIEEAEGDFAEAIALLAGPGSD
jgi:hypothetical protein